jgi:hypothetical protein
VLLTVVWSGVVAAVAFKIVDLTLGLRVPEDEEREGLDISSHGDGVRRAYAKGPLRAGRAAGSMEYLPAAHFGMSPSGDWAGALPVAPTAPILRGHEGQGDDVDAEVGADGRAVAVGCRLRRGRGRAAGRA